MAAELTDTEALRLTRYMTPAGLDAALTLYGAAGIQDAISEHGGDLRLAAAELLESLPPPAAEDAGLASFKLDVLEFKFRDSSSAAPDFAAIAARLRAQHQASAQVSANPAPEFGEWGLR